MARFFLPTTARPAAALLLLGLGLLALATGAVPDLIVQDNFLDAAEAQQLQAQLPASSRFRQLVDVPAAIYGRLASVFADGAGADSAIANSLTVPARGETGSVKPHQDRHADGALAEGKVGLVYLAGDGQLAFTHTATGEETVVDVKPGRLLAWDNAAYTHELVAPASGGAARAMLGPMAFKAGSGFMTVGVPPSGCWLVNSQVCAASLRVSAGGIITLTVTYVVTGKQEFDRRELEEGEEVEADGKRELAAFPDLELVLTNDAAAGQLTLLKTTIKPSPTKPKLTAVTTDPAAVVYTVPADKVVQMKTYKIQAKYRVASSVATGTEFVFTFGATGGLTTSTTVTVAPKK